MNKIISLFSLLLLFAQTVSAQVPSAIIDSLETNNVRVNNELESKNGFGSADGSGLTEVLGYWSKGSNDVATSTQVSSQDFIALSTMALQFYQEVFKVDVSDYLNDYRATLDSDFAISTGAVFDPYYLILQMDDYFDELIPFIQTEQSVVESVYNQGITEWNSFKNDVRNLKQGNEYLNIDMHKLALQRLVTLRKVRDSIIGCNAASGCSKEFHYAQDPRCPELPYEYGNAVIWPGSCLNAGAFQRFYIDADGDGYRRNGEYVQWLPPGEYESLTLSTENDCDDGNPDQYDLFQGHCPVVPASYTNECGATVFCALDQGISLPCVLAPDENVVQSSCDDLVCEGNALKIASGYDAGLVVQNCEFGCQDGACIGDPDAVAAVPDNCSLDVSSELEQTVVASGGSLSKTISRSEETFFHVDVWTEDLNYDIVFKDASGAELQRYTQQGHYDFDYDISHFEAARMAHSVEVEVSEDVGGGLGSDNIGYKIDVYECTTAVSEAPSASSSGGFSYNTVCGSVIEEAPTYEVYACDEGTRSVGGPFDVPLRDQIYRCGTYDHTKIGSVHTSSAAPQLEVLISQLEDYCTDMCPGGSFAVADNVGWDMLSRQSDEYYCDQSVSSSPSGSSYGLGDGEVSVQGRLVCDHDNKWRLRYSGSDFTCDDTSGKSGHEIYRYIRADGTWQERFRKLVWGNTLNRYTSYQDPVPGLASTMRVDTYPLSQLSSGCGNMIWSDSGNSYWVEPFTNASVDHAASGFCNSEIGFYEDSIKDYWRLEDYGDCSTPGAIGDWVDVFTCGDTYPVKGPTPTPLAGKICAQVWSPTAVVLFDPATGDRAGVVNEPEDQYFETFIQDGYPHCYDVCPSGFNKESTHALKCL